MGAESLPVAGKELQRLRIPPDDVATLRYGFAWWSRTFYEKDEWYMSGNGSQFCFLFPKENMVMTKINSWQNEVQVNHQEFYPLVKKAVRR